MHRLNGVPVAFNKNKVQLVSSYGKIMAHHPSVQTTFNIEFMVFSPKVGDITKVSGKNRFLTPVDFFFYLFFRSLKQYMFDTFMVYFVKNVLF